MTPTDPTPRSDLSLGRSLWPYLRPDLGRYAAALLLAPVTVFLVVLQPRLLQHAIDTYVIPGDPDGVARTALWYLAAVVAAFFLQVAHVLLLSQAAVGTITRLRRKVYTHTIRQSQAFFDTQPTGRLLTRATSDVDALGETLTAGAVTIVLDVLQVAGVLAAMFWLDWRLTLVLLFVGPPLALVIELLRRRLRRMYAEVRTSLADLNAYLSERLEGVSVVQLYSDEDRTLGQFGRRLHRYRDATIRTNVYDALVYATVDGLTSITLALMLWYGSGGILDGILTAGVLAAFIDYVAKLFRPIQEFSAKIAILQRASAALAKIFSLLDDERRVPEGDATIDTPRGHVVLDDVGFAYGDGPDILQGVSLQVRPGEVVALVGRTGSGKTTLGRLITRQYAGWSGRITLDGIPLQTLSHLAIRRAVGTVAQDVQLFPGTVRFNLTLGKPIDDARVLEAVRAAHAAPVVTRLGGLDGIVEESGRNVSSGEAQLLSFARALIADPTVVILDEATASVDSLTEAQIQAATEAILARKTTVVIAHRLSTIVHADRIVLLDAGRVVEVGPHAELLARGGMYASLFHEQFADAMA